MAKAKRIIKRLVRKYNNYDVDWMGYPITDDNYYTRHHIDKKAYCYPVSNNKLNNSALLGRISHDLLNYLECNYVSLYDEWNDFFLDMIYSSHFSENLLDRMLELRKKTEYIIYTDKNICEGLRNRFYEMFLLDDYDLVSLDRDDEYHQFCECTLCNEMQNKKKTKSVLAKRKARYNEFSTE